jgi:hypothetical protein
MQLTTGPGEAGACALEIVYSAAVLASSDLKTVTADDRSFHRWGRSSRSVAPTSGATGLEDVDPLDGKSGRQRQRSSSLSVL